MDIERKKILLCLIHDFSFKDIRFNMGAAFISASLKQRSFDVNNFIWDVSRDTAYNEENLGNALSRHDIDVLMCGGSLFDREELDHIFKTAKGKSGDIITVQGGVFVSFSPIEAMTLLPECDIGVIGEGEITVCELMDTIEDGGDMHTVKSIIYRDGHSGFVTTESQTDVPDLARLPIPDYEGFFGDRLDGMEVYSISSGRGCNYACTFCSKFGKRYRERPLWKIFEEIDYYASKYRLGKLFFTNEFFNTAEEYLGTFCEKVKSYGIPFRLATRLSPALTPEVLKRLKDSGIAEIFLGLESADETVLASMRKGTSVELMLKVLRDLKAARINANGLFIFGDTVENHQTIQNTLDFIRRHRDLFFSLGLGMIRLFPGAPLYDRAVSESRIDPFPHIVNHCPPTNISQLGDDEYDYLRDYYFNYFHNMEFATDLNIRNVTFRRTNISHFDFCFECSSCGEMNAFAIDLSQGVHDDYRTNCFFCICGERLRLDFYSHTVNKWNILEMLLSHRTAFYGIGEVFNKVYFKCELSKYQETEFFLVDGRAKKAPTMSSKSNSELDSKIHPPELMGTLGIEKVIVTISGYYHDLEAVVNGLRMRYPDVEFLMWYELADYTP